MLPRNLAPGAFNVALQPLKLLLHNHLALRTHGRDFVLGCLVHPGGFSFKSVEFKLKIVDLQAQKKSQLA
jgi:hypothetical protein